MIGSPVIRISTKTIVTRMKTVGMISRTADHDVAPDPAAPPLTRERFTTDSSATTVDASAIGSPPHTRPEPVEGHIHIMCPEPVEGQPLALRQGPS